MTRRLLLSMLAVVAFATAWWLASTRMMLDIDWDNAAHLYSIEQAHAHNLTEGYTAHIALIPLYACGARLAHLFGGSTLDGIRLVNALAVAAAVVFLAATLQANRVGLAGTILLCLLWLTSVDGVFLMRTVEDDCLTLATCAGLMWAMLTGPPGGWRKSFLVGCALGAGFLLNYPAIVFLPVILIWAALAERPSLRTGPVRVVAALGGFAAAVAAWGLWLRLHGRPWAGYWQMLTAIPSDHVAGRPSRWDQLIPFHVELLPKLLVPEPWTKWVVEQPRTTALLMGAAIGGLGVACVRTRFTRRGWLIGLATIALVLCGVPAALKADWTLYERFVHIPLALALLGGALMTGRFRKAVLAAAGVILVLQLISIARLPSYASVGGALTRLSEKHPDASMILISEDDYNPQDYGKLIGALVIPKVRMFSRGGSCSGWPLPVRDFVLVNSYKREPIPGAVFTPGAQALLSN